MQPSIKVLKSFFKLTLIITALFCLSSCMAIPLGFMAGAGVLELISHQNNQPQLTPLEIQTLQTREYEASKHRVFASVVSVFQDLGYTLSAADEQSGFIKAKSLLRNSHHLNATAFIEAEGNKTKVRLSFVKVKKLADSDGRFQKNNTQLLEATLYQNAFDKIDSEIFVQSHSSI